MHIALEEASCSALILFFVFGSQSELFCAGKDLPQFSVRTSRVKTPKEMQKLLDEDTILGLSNKRAFPIIRFLFV